MGANSNEPNKFYGMMIIVVAQDSMDEDRLFHIEPDDFRKLEEMENTFVFLLEDGGGGLIRKATAFGWHMWLKEKLNDLWTHVRHDLPSTEIAMVWDIEDFVSLRDTPTSPSEGSPLYESVARCIDRSIARLFGRSLGRSIA